MIDPTRPTTLDRHRRVHLGLLRTELSGRSFERFFRWDMADLPSDVDTALASGAANPTDALLRSDVNRLLEPGYQPLETGWAELPDGTTHVATLTRFPGATAEMIDWWFGWHISETARYKLWHPQAHLFTQPRFARTDAPGLPDREKYLGNTSWVDEYIGRHIQRLSITFRPPSELGFDEGAFAEAAVGTAVCARVGFSDRPADTGHLVHLIRETSDGCEMRSRFWLGDAHIRLLPEGNPIDRLLAMPALRRKLLPTRIGHDLLVHCAEEMNHLASFLPELYAQEAGRGRA